MSYFLLIRLARLLTLIFIGHRNFQLRGVANVPRTGSLLVVSNHVGTADPVLIGAWTPRPVWFMAKSELFTRWLTRSVVTAYHAFPVIRHSPDRKALRRAIGLLRQGQAVVLFPEGHRSDDGRLHRAEPGAGFLARRSQVPLVPLAISGTQHVLGRQLKENQQIIIQVVTLSSDTEQTPEKGDAAASDELPEWCNVYEGLTDEQIADLESVMLQRANLTRPS